MILKTMYRYETIKNVLNEKSQWYAIIIIALKKKMEIIIEAT
jgi:hypothetical protein